MRILPTLLVIVTLSVTSTVARSAIILDYTHDTFFTGNATAMATIEAAATDISNVLNYTGTAITAAQDTVVGVNGGTTITYDFQFNYTNPATDATETITSPGSLPGGGLGVGEIRTYVGVRQLTGSTLAQAGPGVVNFEDVDAFGILPEVPAAVASANAAGTAAYGRGDGPVIGSLGGDVAGTPIDVDFGAAIGNMWFDSDTDNNGVEDFDDWHLDHTMPVAVGRDDLYSVAVHELLHVAGLGVSDSWDSLVSGTDWLGANVIALMGSGVGLINPDGAHVADGVMSTSLFDGSSQESIMAASLIEGTRKHLTALDVAFLQDIGYANASAPPVAIPEPGSFAFCALGSVCLIGQYRRRRRSAATSKASQAA